MFRLWQSALNNTHSHCGTRLRGSFPTPLGMKTAPLAEKRRSAFFHLVHPGSTPSRLWRPKQPESPSCLQQSHQTHTDWRTPFLWSGKSKLTSRQQGSDSTGDHHVIHREPFAGPAWRTERRRRVLLLKTAKPAENARVMLKYYSNLK